MTRSTTEVLRDALAHFERLQAYADGDLADQLVIDAICMRLSAGIETLARLDPEVLAELSTSAACADLIEMSLSDLRDAQENLDSPDQVAQTFRKMAGDFEEKATEIDDAELKTGVEKYVAKVKDLAQVAESGETPDINVLVKADSDLADACS